MAGKGGIPSFRYPEDAARSLGRVMRHVEWRAQPYEEPAGFADAEEDRAAEAIARGLARGGGWLGIEEVTELLTCYGIAMPEWRLVDDSVAAGHAAEEMGGRVALKAVGPAIVHKTDLDAVRIGLAGAADVSWAAVQMDEALSAAGVERRFIVQEMVEGGTELLIGVVSDPLFGPVLACGAGGTQAELLKDVAVRICPLSAREASEMIRSLAIYPLLTGFRGAAGADLAALEGAAADRRDGRSPPRDRRARPQPSDGGPGRGDGRRRSDPGRRRPAAAPLAQHLEGRKLAAPCEPPG